MNKRICRVTIGYEELERLLRIREGFDIVRVEDTTGRVAITLTSRNLPEARTVVPRKRLEEVQTAEYLVPVIPRDVHQQILRARVQRAFDVDGSTLLRQGRTYFINNLVRRLSEPISSKEQSRAASALEIDDDDEDDD